MNETGTFYEAEALRGGRTVRQLDRQINTQLYERITLSAKRIAPWRRPPRLVGQRAPASFWSFQ